MQETQLDYSVEEALSLLDEYVNEMEKSDITLADAFDKYNEGMKLVEYCNQKLSKLQKEVQIIQNRTQEIENDENKGDS